MDRAAFLLVALVITAHVVVVMGSVTMCWLHADAIIDGRFKCDADNRLGEALAAALAAAIAFAGARK